jgi:hypothetical protein
MPLVVLLKEFFSNVALKGILDLTFSAYVFLPVEKSSFFIIYGEFTF